MRAKGRAKGRKRENRKTKQKQGSKERTKGPEGKGGTSGKGLFELKQVLQRFSTVFKNGTLKFLYETSNSV